MNQSFSTNQVCFPNQDIIEGWSRTINFSVSTASVPGFLFLKPPTSRLKFKCLSGIVVFMFPCCPCSETSCCMLHGECTDLLHFQMEREAQRETEKRKATRFSTLWTVCVLLWERVVMGNIACKMLYHYTM